MRGSHFDFEVWDISWIADGTVIENLAGETAQKWQQTWKSDNTIKYGSYQSGSP